MTFIERVLADKKTALLTLIAFLLPWQTRYIFGGVPLGNTVSEFTTLSLYVTETLFVFGALALVKEWRWTKYRPVVFTVLGFVAVVMVSAVFSRDAALAWHALLHIACATALFMALLDDDIRVDVVLKGLLGGFVVPIVLGVYQIVAGGSGSLTLLGLATRDAGRLGDAVVMIGGERVLRAYGSFPHPNIFGGYLAFAVLFAARTLKGCVRWLGIGVFSVALMLTASRAAVLALVLSAIMAVGLWYARDRVWIRRATMASVALLLVAGLAGLFLAPGLIMAMRGGGVTEARSVIERVEQYAVYPDVLRHENILIGIGPGTYVAELARTEPGKSIWVYQPIHNALLLMIGELGVLGVLAFGVVIKKVLEVTRGQVWLPVVLVGALTLGLFDHYLWSMWPGLALFAFVVAMGMRLGRRTQDTE